MRVAGYMNTDTLAGPQPPLQPIWFLTKIYPGEDRMKEVLAPSTGKLIRFMSDCAARML